MRDESTDPARALLGLFRMIWDPSGALWAYPGIQRPVLGHFGPIHRACIKLSNQGCIDLVAPESVACGHLASGASTLQIKGGHLPLNFENIVPCQGSGDSGENQLDRHTDNTTEKL